MLNYGPVLASPEGKYMYCQRGKKRGEFGWSVYTIILMDLF